MRLSRPQSLTFHPHRSRLLPSERAKRLRRLLADLLISALLITVIGLAWAFAMALALFAH